MLNIEIRTVPSRKQRYPTAGDYFEDPSGKAFILVCKLGTWEYEALVVLHELTEYLLVKASGVSLSAIDEFDKNFEEERDRGMHGPHDEPGDELDAPYYLQHCAATGVERMAAALLRVNWREYSHAIDGLVWDSGAKRGKKKK